MIEVVGCVFVYIVQVDKECGRLVYVIYLVVDS